MATTDAVCLLAWITGRMVDAGDVGDCCVMGTREGPVIEQADERILVSVQVVEVADEKWLRFALEEDASGEQIGVLTLSGINRTVRYRVVGHVNMERSTILCERIDDNAAARAQET